MKLRLTRKDYSEDGIFSTLTGPEGVPQFYTLEHSYNKKPKIPKGTYTCKRGFFPKHKETFEVMNVPGHTAILFHVGNYNKDSEGCILVGSGRIGNYITASKLAFSAFMIMLDGIDSFELTVE